MGGGGGGGGTPADPVGDYRATRETAYQNWKNAESTHKGNVNSLGDFGLSYDTNNKRWNTINEKEDHATIANSSLLEIKPTNLKEKELWIKWKQSYDTGYNEYNNAQLEGRGEWHQEGTFSPSNHIPRDGDRWGWITLGKNPESYTAARKIIRLVSEATGDINRGDRNAFDNDYFDQSYGHSYWGSENSMATDWNAQKSENQKVAIDNEYNQKWNVITNRINETNVDLNNKNAAKNQAYNKIKEISNRTQGSDFLEQRNKITDEAKPILQNAGFTDAQINGLAIGANDEFKSFYRTEKLRKWDSNLAHPIPGPTGSTFDGVYYFGQSPAAANTWNDAVANDDIDITERYNNANTFALQHWSNQGKDLGLRAYAPTDPTAATGYEEITTDADVQAARDRQLGLTTDEDGTYNNEAFINKILNIPYIAGEYDKASSDEGDDYWKELGDEWNLNEKDRDQFVALFRLSERDEDKSISFLHNLNNPQYDIGISELEDAVMEAAGDKARVDIQKFGNLTQNVLKETISEIKEAKEKESFLGTIKNFAGYGEIMDINKSLSNSLLGDLNKGGYLNWMGGETTRDALEQSMENITGVRNNVTHNWQKWYDEELKTKYEAGGTFYKGEDDPATAEDERESYEIDAEFGRAFIDEYLTKRFDQSKSMNEFVEYLDVRDSEKNPFQTMDMLSALNLHAKLKADEWQTIRKEEIDNGQADRHFDAKFYLNPSSGEENIGKTSDYIKQSERLQKDLQAAKTTPDELIDSNLPALGTWRQQLYKYGINVNDETVGVNGLSVGENNFAKMHFDIVGQSKGYDAAEDYLNPSAIRKHVYENILPELDDEALEQGTIFGQFITPSEFADDALEGVDPNVPESWQEVLNEMEGRGEIDSAEDWNGTYDDLKEMIMEVMRTGSAQQIRENIKYLNEKRKRPTQKELGVLYIERESDYKPEKLEGKTALFKTFQNAGFQGNEEDFYGDFFPDLNIEDQKLLTAAGENEGLSGFMDMDLNDPFASFTQISEFMKDDEDENDEEEENKKEGTSYFDLSVDDDSDWDYKKTKTKSTFGNFSKLFNKD